MIKEMLTILEKELNDNYMQLYYNDEVFKYNYIITDEWWHKTWLPNSHKRLTIEVFINQLYAMSLKYNNPPIISFSIGLYPVKISEGRISYHHEDNMSHRRLDDIIKTLYELDTQIWSETNNSSFIGDCDIIFLPIKKRGGQRKRTNIPRGLRHEVFKRDDYTCVECGVRKSNGAILHVDHKIPVSKGGTDELDNLQTLCSDCNLNKSDVIQ